MAKLRTWRLVTQWQPWQDHMRIGINTAPLQSWSESWPRKVAIFWLWMHDMVELSAFCLHGGNQARQTRHMKMATPGIFDSVDCMRFNPCAAASWACQWCMVLVMIEHSKVQIYGTSCFICITQAILSFHAIAWLSMRTVIQCAPISLSWQFLDTSANRRLISEMPVSSKLKYCHN